MRGKRAFVVLTVYLLLVAGFAWMVESTHGARRSRSGFGSALLRVGGDRARQLFIGDPLPADADHPGPRAGVDGRARSASSARSRRSTC